MPKLFTKNEDCCGCSACVNACPKNAIQMREDDKGFLYPHIDPALCIECNLCEKVCPLKHVASKDSFQQKAYGMKNKDNNERKNSSSGSVFIEVAKSILSKQGSVYGVQMEADFRVDFGRAVTLEEARRFQGSKYVQSIKGETFKAVKQDLTEGKAVLFTGTPCEVSGLKKYLGKDYDNLFTIDIICHGVPSQKLMAKSIEAKEKEYKSSIMNLKFRDKNYGWRNQEVTMTFENQKVYHAPIWEDQFYRLFTSNYILRDSCYSCHFANMKRQGDMTIGDYWNIKNVNESFEDNLGVSSVIVNTQKGQSLFDDIKNNFEIFDCSLEDVVQKNLQHPSPKPENFDVFQHDYETNGMNYCLDKYGKMGKGERIRRLLSPIKQKVVHLLKK